MAPRERFFPCQALLGAILLGLVTYGCGAEDSDSSSEKSEVSKVAKVAYELPAVIDVAQPEPMISVMDVVEDMSEAVANSLVDLANVLRRRAYGEAPQWFTDDFAGLSLASMAKPEIESLPLGAQALHYDPETAEIAGRDAWLASLEDLLSVYGVLDAVVAKVKGAEFETSAVGRGRVRLKLSTFGLGADRQPLAMTAWAWVGVVERRGRWMIERFQTLSLDIAQRATPLFADVTVGAGVANQTGIFGKHGNNLFYWNGAASHDVNGDGLWDLFVPTLNGCFLYLNNGEGGFDEVSKAWGLADEKGGTGALFFDYDNDGDTDLAVGHVGWVRPNGSLGGDTLRLWRNDRNGFTDVSEESGFGGRHVAFSLVAGDYDGDGFTDVYVCSYNRMDAVYPESWYHAENGTPNGLYRNLGDGTFVDMAAQWGADDSRWTFAAAAHDFDADGDLDLYLANDYGDNSLLVNLGDGHFQKGGAKAELLDSGNGMGTAWGDVNNDGDLDLYVANMSSTAGNRILKRMVDSADGGMGGTLLKLASGNSIFKRVDDGFERVPAAQGGVGAAWAWSSSLSDFDLDGCVDVFVANGFISGESAADT
ncbi:MAG: hypothetical protein ACI9EF_001088 [Pseudohongiellaceae bacterium]|jgi:hypothetical protein